MVEETKKEIGAARVVFESRFKAYVDYQTSETDSVSRERDAIQLFSLTMVKVLFLLGENKHAPMLLGFIQTAMGDTVTPKGLKHPTIMAEGQSLIEVLPEKPEKLMVLRLIQESEGRLGELTLPIGDEGHFYPATVIYFFQYLIRTLSEPSLFFLMLVLGGVMEYYEKIGKTNDIKALIDAPVYGFTTAVRYIEDERRRNPPPPATN